MVESVVGPVVESVVGPGGTMTSLEERSSDRPAASPPLHGDAPAGDRVPHDPSSSDAVASHDSSSSDAVAALDPSSSDAVAALETDDLRTVLSRVLPARWDQPISARDQQAFDANVRSAWMVIFYRTASVVRNRADAEEITQEVFCRVLGRMRGDSPSEPLRAAYLKTAARNLLYDRWRRDRRARDLNVVYSNDPSNAPPSLEDEVLERIDAKLLISAMRRLPAMHLHVLRLRVFEGLSAEETGAVIGKSAAAVRQIQHRSLSMLRTDLAGSTEFAGHSESAVSSELAECADPSAQPEQRSEPAVTSP